MNNLKYILMLLVSMMLITSCSSIKTPELVSINNIKITNENSENIY